MTRRDKNILIIVAVVFYGVCIAVYYNRELERFFMSHRRNSQYICSNCGAHRRVIAQKKFGFFRSSSEKISITELSRKLDPNSECSHDWLYLSMSVSGWEQGHGGIAMRSTLLDLTFLPELHESLFKFAEEKGIKPQEVWRNISTYLAFIERGEPCPLDDFLRANFYADDILFKDWLTTNYELIVSQVAKTENDKKTDE